MLQFYYIFITAQTRKVSALFTSFNRRKRDIDQKDFKSTVISSPDLAAVGGFAV